jgi:hypothetical protein
VGGLHCIAGIAISVALIAHALTAAEAQTAAPPAELQRFEGTWKGKWDNRWPVEVTLKHTGGNEFVCVRRHLENLSDKEYTVQQHKGTYDPVTRTLKEKDVEYFWHDDEQRLVAKGRFPKYTRHAILRRESKSTDESSAPEDGGSADETPGND